MSDDIYYGDEDGVPCFEFLMPKECERPYTITEVNNGIVQIFEQHNTLVWIEGELSGWKSYPSGHCYFKLKDENSQIPGVMWRPAADKLDFRPRDNMAVFAVASITVYPKGGYYQLNVHKMMQAGEGALHLKFEKLKQKLLQEGLFDDKHKRPLPPSVSALGVITSRKGAALWDIVRVVAKRAPQTDIVLIDTLVQGDKAAAQIAKSIRMMNGYGKVDLMIVGRGGGAIEDLWAFNEEVVARAIRESSIPIISAVGHEIDFTIADFAADVRAPTPSAAAEMAVADTQESRRYFDQLKARFSHGASRYFDDINSRVRRIKSSRAMSRPFRAILEYEQGLDDIRGSIYRDIKSSMQSNGIRLKSLAGRLNALSPLAVLGRGYAIVQDAGGSTLKSAGRLNQGDSINIRFADGAVGAQIISSQ
ncbi:MAG: exodeoxyribonuclease VII large subunit [Chitinispirillia bacterium]|nr:exodeoxyribonuclease VII large subunit [Chitinispirillia bacterium]